MTTVYLVDDLTQLEVLVELRFFRAWTQCALLSLLLVSTCILGVLLCRPSAREESSTTATKV